MDEALFKKLLTTFVIYYCSITMGVAETFFGPSLMEFKNALGTDIETINSVGTATQIFRVGGIFIISFVLSYVRREIISTFLLAILGLSLIVLPFSSSLTSFAVVMSFGAFAKGGYTAAQLIWLLKLWKESAGPFLQADHFFSALGVIFPPIFFAPYLSSTNNPTNQLCRLALILPASLPIPDWGFSLESKAMNLFIPSALCGGMITIGAVLQLMLVFVLEEDTRSDYETLTHASEEKLLEEGTIESKNERSLGRTIILLTSAIVIYSSFMSSEILNIDFFIVFLNISPLQLPTQEGAHILISAALADMFATFAGIFLNTKIESRLMIWGNIVSLFAGFILLWISSAFVYTALLCIAPVLVGIGISTAIPSLYHYVDSYFHFTNVTGAILVVASGLVTTICKLILGRFIETKPFIYIYMNLGIAASGAVGMVWFQFLTHNQSTIFT